MNMAATRKAKRRHGLKGIALGAQALLATPSLLFDPTFGTRLGSFLAGPEQTPQVPEAEHPETLTEAILRKKRLLRLMQAQGAPIEGALTSPGVDIQAAQGPAGQAGAILGGPLTRLR